MKQHHCLRGARVYLSGPMDFVAPRGREEARLDIHPQNPLLPFLARLTHQLPQRWDDHLKKYVPNDDRLLWEWEGPQPAK